MFYPRHLAIAAAAILALTACSGDGEPSDPTPAPVETSAEVAETPDAAPEPVAPSGIAEGIAAGMGWEITDGPDSDQLPDIQDAVVAGGKVWVLGQFDGQAAEDAGYATCSYLASIDPATLAVEGQCVPFSSSLAAAGDTVIVSGPDHAVVAVDATTGTVGQPAIPAEAAAFRDASPKSAIGIHQGLAGVGDHVWLALDHMMWQLDPADLGTRRRAWT